MTEPESPTDPALADTRVGGADRPETETRSDRPAVTYTMFPPGECDVTLPLNRITDVFLFSRFVGLTVDTEARGRQRLVLPRTPLLRQLPRTLAGAARAADVTDAEGGLPIEDWAEHGTAVRPLAEDLAVPDVDAVLANGHVSLDEDGDAIKLDRRAVADLLAGRPTAITRAQGIVRLVPSPLPDEAPVAGVVPVGDLAAFLADPVVPGAGGVPIPLTLTKDHVTQLRATGRAELRVGDQHITLTVTAKAAGARPAPDPLDAVPVREAAEAGDRVGAVPSAGAAALAGAGTVVSTSGQPPVFELALHLPWTQTWTLLGYSRGSLLNTVSLAPQEETTIEIFTWDRRRAETQRSSSVEAENNVEQSDTVRLSSDVLNETRSGNEFTVKAGGEFGINIYDVIKIGANVSAEDKSTFAGTARSTTGFVHESVTRTADKLKQSRQTKVTETSEVGREERVTRKLRNPNMCRTLNLDYFEILEHHSVCTEFSPDRAGLCVLVDNPLRLPLDRTALRVQEKTLRRSLLDRELVDGFAAARLLDQWELACPVACTRCTCSAPHGASTESLPDKVRSGLELVGATMAGIFTANLDGLYDALEVSDYSYFRIDALMQEHRRWVYDELLLLGAPGVRTALNLIFSAWTNNYQFKPYHINRLRIELDQVGGVAGIGPKKLYGENTQHLDRAIGNEYSRWRLSSPNKPIEIEFIRTFVYTTGLLDSFNDHGLIAALTTLLADYDTFVKGTTDAAAEQVDHDGAATELVQSTFGLEEVTAALERESALLAHLNLNAGYYRAELWKALTPATQSALLQPLLPDVVDPRAVGSFGDKLAFPVRLERVPAARRLLTDLIEKNDELIDLTRSDTVSVPTAAVTMESRLGACDACEPFIHDSRELELRTRAAAASQAEAEAKRYNARLVASPPQLDDPSTDDRPVRIELSQSP